MYIGSVQKVKKLTLKDWTIEQKAEHIIIKKQDKSTTLPEVEVTTDDSLDFSISVYGWPLPSTHQIYKDNFRSVQYKRVSQLLNQISSYKICEGVSNDIAVVSSIRL